ncbi:MAG: hypothetical protein RR150_12335, partial [Clostridia bacterium]
GAVREGVLIVARKSVPARQQSHVKHVNKFIDLPKDKLIKLLIGIGLLILVIVLFFVFRNAFDGHLPVKDGAAVTQGDNWIIGNTGSTTKPRYFKLATAGETEGYTMTHEGSTADSSLATYAFAANDAANPVESAYIMTAKGDYDTIASALKGNLTSYIPTAVVTELDSSDVAGRPARSLGYTYNYPDVDPKTNAQLDTTTYIKGYNIYLKADHGMSLLVHAQSTAPTEADLATDQAVQDACRAISAQIQFDEKTN